jgi:pantoate--beta-alanine ligase
MKIFKHSADLYNYLHQPLVKKIKIGFVPTMGALHEGHLSLLKTSKCQTNLTVCSIFVNPTQFNNQNDFEKYPNTIENDILLLESHGCDVLFLPDINEMYPNEESKNKYYHLGYLETILEGKFRPGHFQGVCMIVETLLKMVQPESIFLGQKDFQQCMVIKKLIALKKFPVNVIVCPTLRESSGLAMSSRNLRLNNEEKILATKLFLSLKWVKEKLPTTTDFSILQKEQIEKLEQDGFKVEYLELAKRDNLELTETYRLSEKYVLLIAAYLNDIRLIDNLLL